MSNTISGGISFSGIGSGTDFSAMIDQLLEVESYRLYSLQDTRDEATETYEAFQDLIKTVGEAQESLSLLNSYEEFLTKIASSSSEATLGVKADANAVDGTHKIEVTQLASNAIWANKGSYAEKTTVINTSGTAQDFSYTYEGVTRTLSVPAGTTLEGFANMVNQDKANPGVNVSILKVANGYTFQMAGDKSGAEASLEIHPSNLSGLSGAGGIWESTSSVDLAETLNGGNIANSYTYDLHMRDGVTTHSVTIMGDRTQEDLVTAINAEAGSDIASIDPTTGKMVITGLDSMDITTTPHGGTATTESFDVLQNTTINFTGDLSSRTMAGPAIYTFTADDGTFIDIEMEYGHNQKQILDKLKAEGYNYTATENGGNTEVIIDGINNVPQNFLDTDLSLRGSVPVSSITMPSASLDATIADAHIYNFTNTNGELVEISMEANHSARDVLDALTDKGYTVSGTDEGGLAELDVTGIQDMNALASQVSGATVAGSSVNINIADTTGQVLGAVGETTTYTFETTFGTSFNVDMDGEHSLQDVLDSLGPAFPSTVTTAGGRQSVTILGIKNADSLMSTPAAAPTPSYGWNEYEQTVDPDATIQTGVVPYEMEFTFTREDGTSHTETVYNTETMQQVLDRLNDPTNPDNPGIAYTHDATTGILSFAGITSVSGAPASLGLGGSLTGSDAWQVQASQDAIFKVDNWPQELTSSSNEVTGVLEGITLSLRDVGTAQITVAADTDSVKANIQTVLDAINSVLKKVQDLTAITDDVSDSYDDDGQSLSNTTGSALTGNYSTQLFASRFKSLIASSPPGFQPMTADDIFSGDFISGLAQMGIKVSSDVDDPNFGLFAIAPYGSTDSIQALDQEAFDNAIANNLEDVIAFFANDSEGRSSSPNFRYANHIDGITKPGTYSVAYDVDSTGTPVNVYINGRLASPSENDPNTFSVAGDAGDAGGMSITVDNLTPGTNYTGTVSVQQGKVSQIEDFFASELTYVEPKLSDPGLSDGNGGLKIAEEGAKSLIEQLDNKISEESERLERWEYNERLKFARLDTLLGSYNSEMEMLTQQLTQLS